MVKARARVLAKGALVIMFASVTITATATAQAGSVDVNHASAEQLATVSGIGKVTAERIVRERGRGLYESMAHLSERLAGIGPKRLERLERAGLCAGTAQKTCVGNDASSLAAMATKQPKTRNKNHSNTHPQTQGVEAVTPVVINLP